MLSRNKKDVIHLAEEVAVKIAEDKATGKTKKERKTKRWRYRSPTRIVPVRMPIDLLEYLDSTVSMQNDLKKIMTHQGYPDAPLTGEDNAEKSTKPLSPKWLTRNAFIVELIIAGLEEYK